MPVDLNSKPRDVDPENEPGRTMFGPMLRNLQANILKPHGRDFARHVFLRFTASPGRVKRWIREEVTPKVSRAESQYNLERGPDGRAVDGGLVIGFFLSADGYRHLGLAVNQFDGIFREGMKRGGGEDPRPETWEAPFRGEVHALVTLADDAFDTVRDAALALKATANGIAEVLVIEEGNVLRRGKEVVEHFGYFDGISKPVFTRPDLERERRDHGGFDGWNPGAPLKLVLLDDPHAQATDAFGSYLVYRKLAQDVQAFEQRVAALAAGLNPPPAGPPVSSDLAGALAVGRFKDGTPVVLRDAAGLGPANNFNFEEDGSEFRCPFHSHIRKVNPRGTTPLTSEESERGRRIARRGIPYGPPIAGVSDPHPDIPTSADPAARRGLLFMCFQENIATQFRFIQTTWADNNKFPTNVNPLDKQPNTGDDPVIGQGMEEPQAWPEQWNDPVGPSKKFDKGMRRFNFESAVTLRGGEYFFAPSLPFLESL